MKTDSDIARVDGNGTWRTVERSLLAAAIIGAFVCLWRHETAIATSAVEQSNLTAMVQEMRGDLKDILTRLPSKP